MFYIFPKGSLIRKLYSFNINPKLLAINEFGAHLSVHNNIDSLILNINYKRYDRYNEFTSEIVTNDVVEWCSLIEKPFDEYHYKVNYLLSHNHNIIHSTKTKYHTYNMYDNSLSNINFNKIDKLFINTLIALKLIPFIGNE